MNDYLYSLNLFTDAEIDQFVQLATKTVLKKGDYFIQEGSVCQKIAFVESGVLRHFVVSERGDDTTYCFSFPGQFVTAYSSLISYQPTLENIQAITDVEVNMVHKSALERAFANNANWLLFGKAMAEKEYIYLEKRVFSLLKYHAKQRYWNLLRDNPDYIQSIPLQYLASYLGVTQRHLSRLRREWVY
jgi:CRP-like cAMP-binding protein